MRAPEPIRGVRVVADAPVLDGRWTDGEDALRFASDEAFVLGDTAVVADVPDGITELEDGFVGWWLTRDELEEVTRHLEWTIPTTRPALAQGLIAGVPAKIWLADDRALLLCAAAYAHELVDRLP